MPTQCVTELFGKIIKTITIIYDVVSQCLCDANTMPTRCAPEKIFNLTMHMYEIVSHDVHMMLT